MQRLKMAPTAKGNIGNNNKTTTAFRHKVQTHTQVRPSSSVSIRHQENGGSDNGMPENCLICNNPCITNGYPSSRPSTSAAAASASHQDTREFRQVLFKAFDIHVNESYFEETEGELPLCAGCILKCGQLKLVAQELQIIQREYNRLIEEIAFAIVDTVASDESPNSKIMAKSRAGGGNSNDKNLQSSIYKKVQNVEVELIQQLIFESWHDKFPSSDFDAEENSCDFDFPPDQEDQEFEDNKIFPEVLPKLKPEQLPKRPTLIPKPTLIAKPTATSSKSNSNSSTPPPILGKTTVISITTREESTATTSTTSSSRRKSIGDVEGETNAETEVKDQQDQGQITITNGNGDIVKNSSLGLGPSSPNEPSASTSAASPELPKERSNSASPQDYLLGESDLDEDAEIDAEFDMDQLMTPQLNLTAELLKHAQSKRISADGKSVKDKKSMKFPHDLEITEWSGGGRGGDESQKMLMDMDMDVDMDYDEHIGLEEDEDVLDDINLEDFEDGSGTPGKRGGRSLSNSSDNGGLNSNDIEFQQNEEGLYVCMYCTKTFIHKYPYRDHLKTHTGEGPRCPICNKIFPKNHNLMLHMRTHTGEKPYKCEVCRKGFADKSNLKVHMRVHTGERPYKCEFCDQAFVNSSRLVVHRRLHTGDRPFPCEICPRTFSTSNQLQSHTKIHYSQKPFNCEICGKGYSNLTSLTAHMNHFHSGEADDVPV